METLEGKIVLVTGAAKRIGRGIALHLYRAGARVVIHYKGSEEEARRTAEECGDAPVYRANLESVAEIGELYGRIEKDLGKLDGLVNNAARFTQIDPLEVTEADWDFIHNVNLKATFFSCQAAAKVMLRHDGGHIVNISSLGALRPWAEHSHYCASKAGVVHLTRCLAKAWAPKISVNSVAPGVIPFDEAANAEIQAMVRTTPAQRAGTADEIGEAVRYLLSTTRFITGQVIAVDGGLSLK